MVHLSLLSTKWSDISYFPSSHIRRTDYSDSLWPGLSLLWLRFLGFTLINRRLSLGKILAAWRGSNRKLIKGKDYDAILGYEKEPCGDGRVEKMNDTCHEGLSYVVFHGCSGQDRLNRRPNSTLQQGDLTVVGPVRGQRLGPRPAKYVSKIMIDRKCLRYVGRLAQNEGSSKRINLQFGGVGNVSYEFPGESWSLSRHLLRMGRKVKCGCQGPVQ